MLCVNADRFVCALTFCVRRIDFCAVILLVPGYLEVHADYYWTSIPTNLLTLATNDRSASNRTVKLNITPRSPLSWVNVSKAHGTTSRTSGHTLRLSGTQTQVLAALQSGIAYNGRQTCGLDYIDVELLDGTFSAPIRYESFVTFSSLYVCCYFLCVCVSVCMYVLQVWCSSCL